VKAIAAPLPSRARNNYVTQLNGVSCTSWGNCVAVGQYANSSGTREGLIVTQVNGPWSKTAAVALPADAHPSAWSGLSSVKCVSKGNCVTVGVFQGRTHGEGMIVGEGNGVWGHGIDAPNPIGYTYGAYAAQLLALDCSAPGSCVAVGQFTAGQNDRGYAVSEAKGGWGGAQLTPHPSNASAPYYETLNAISCYDAHCSMVGQYQALVGQPAEIVSSS
jgi:hypothetical protein